MAPKRRNLAEALEKYKSSGNNDFFTLENDKDTATVRFLYGSNEEDLDWYPVHQVEIGGKKRWALCPETSDCPLCRAGVKVQLKIFLQLQDDRDGKVKTWERGQKFIPKIIGMMQRYGALYTRKIEVERQGKKGDTSTDYALYPLDPDNIAWDDLPERQTLVGHDGFILERDHTDLQAMADGTFEFTPVAGQRSSGTPASERQQPPSQQHQPRQRQEQAPPQQNSRPQRGTDVF